MKYVPLIGRILFSLIFITSGFGHIFNSGQMAGYAASMGVPMATAAVIITGIMILLGGFSILLGFKPKIGALLLVIFLIPTTFIMHAFWGIEDPMQSQMQMIMFMKNISMTGAALLIYYFGTGPLSLEKQGD
ncbi:MAG: DoxX family protein [Methanobacteriota archaeon]|nr:MAG: DoxX family protein [Euryarchaeota archaeon]